MAVLASSPRDVAAEGESLATRLYAPTSGKIAYRQATVAGGVAGLEVTTVDDVIKLYQKLEGLKLPDEEILSWEFLESADLKLAKLDPPNQKANEPRLFTGLPVWHEYKISFDADTYAHFWSAGDRTEKTVLSPISDVQYRAGKDSEQVNRFPPGTLKASNILPDQQTLFSRSQAFLSQTWTGTPKPDGLMLYTHVGDGYEDHLLVREDSDVILARMLTKRGAVRNFTLHLNLDRRDTPVPHDVPRLTCHFLARMTPEAWLMQGYLLDDVKLDIPIPETDFLVKAQEGQTYVPHGLGGIAGTLRLLRDVANIGARTPQDVRKTEKQFAIEEARKILGNAP